MAQAINNIKAQQPRAIGLDIIRNLPVEPGHEELVNLFKSTPNLFGIEKVVNPGISPPITLDQLEQVGFADIVQDADYNVVRRALLSIADDEDEVQYSLAMKLALYYLEVEEITPEPLDDEQLKVRLGDTIF